jgi:hypothetical protein
MSIPEHLERLKYTFASRRNKKDTAETDYLEYRSALFALTVELLEWHIPDEDDVTKLVTETTIEPS